MTLNDSLPLLLRLLLGVPQGAGLWPAPECVTNVWGLAMACGELVLPRPVASALAFGAPNSSPGGLVGALPWGWQLQGAVDRILAGASWLLRISRLWGVCFPRCVVWRAVLCHGPVVAGWGGLWPLLRASPWLVVWAPGWLL